MPSAAASAPPTRPACCWSSTTTGAALAAGAKALHLGQEDLLALLPPTVPSSRRPRAGVQLGLSSHSLWELCRAAGLRPT
jgi:thiamine monophosphate synthase